MSRAFLDVSLKTVLAGAMVTALAACNREPPAQAANVPPPSESAAAPAQAAPYQRPTADQLYALVAPIALFPDNLVAQTLAASTHPDQVGDARQFIQDHRDLTGAALIDAADSQPWDPSVKSLVAFPAVLDQMANNGEWTDALGQAYANEPTDVMNAIQVMRSRAQAKGNLKSTPQQRVQVVERREPVSQTQVVETDEIVAPPEQTIEIEPADPGVVYVPDYDPDVVYGEPVYSRVYETRYVERGPDYHDAVVAGVIGFGTGILVGELFAHHEHRDRPWGWDSWHTSWRGYHDGGRPTVVYDNHPYVVNRTVVNNRYVDRSVHVDNRHDFGNTYNRPGLPAPGPRPRPAFAPQGAGGMPPRPFQPDYAHMQRPNFAPSALHATAPNAHPALPPPRPNWPNVAQGGHPFPGAPGQAGQKPLQPGRFADRGHVGEPLPPQARQAAIAPEAHGQPRPTPPASQEPRGQMPPPQFAQHAPHIPRDNVARFQPPQPQSRQEALRPHPQPEQHVQAPRPQPQARPERPSAGTRQQPPQRFEPPREMTHATQQGRPEPPRPQPQRPQPQEHHEAPHPAPQQHHDEHKRHDS